MSENKEPFYSMSRATVEKHMRNLDIDPAKVTESQWNDIAERFASSVDFDIGVVMCTIISDVLTVKYDGYSPSGHY